MEREYIILRKPKGVAGTKDVLEGIGFERRRSPEAAPVVEFQKMNADAAADVARSGEADAVVPDIPLKLIRPLAADEGNAVAAGAPICWGLEATGAAQTPFTGKGVRVAVLDTGIDRDHDAFQGVELNEVDFTGEGNGDTDGHGTHCAGTMFGRDVAGTRIGVARGVTYAFIGKVIGKNGGATPALVRAIQAAADDGCQIMSMSLGFDFPGAAARLQDEGFPPDLAAAIALADYRANIRLFDRLGELIQAQGLQSRRELLLFAASGNESKREIDPKYEMPAAPPSEAAGFTSVGAVGRNADGKLAVAAFSNTGCRISAPGVEIVSAQAGSKNGLVAMSGTSMAAPHAAGIAALYLERENAQAAGGGFLRFKTDLLFRILGSATSQSLAPGFTSAQVGLGVIQAPM